jgi:hypothetical protein
MANFKDRIARFMNGRYGIDQLYFGLIVLYTVLFFANASIRSFIIDILMWAVLIFMLYRIFSRNVYARSRENEKFLKIWNPIKATGKLTIRRIKEIKTHRFRKCPHCSTMLRLPRKTGEHTVECPRCHHDFEVRIRF